MLYISLFCVALFIVVFALIMLKFMLVRDTATHKIRLKIQNVKKVIVTRICWAVIGTIAIVYVLTLLMPVVWMLLTSVKDNLDFKREMSKGKMFAFPAKFRFENFPEALEALTIDDGKNKPYTVVNMFANSMVHSVVTTLVSLFWMYSMAYVMARYKWFGNSFLFALGVFLMTVSIVGNIASKMILYKTLGLYDNLYVCIFLPPSTAFSGLYFMMIYGTCKSISQTYTEAAYLDGAGEYTVMFRIIFPMAIPTLTTLFVLAFLQHWNDYETFLVWYPSSPNLSYGLYKFQRLGKVGGKALPITQIIAAMVVVMIPSCILYLATHKVMRSNFVVGGLKG